MQVWGGETRRDQLERVGCGAVRGGRPGRRAGRRSTERTDAAGARAIPAPPRVRNRPALGPPRTRGGVPDGRPAVTTVVCSAARRTACPVVPGGLGFALPQVEPLAARMAADAEPADS